MIARLLSSLLGCYAGAAQPTHAVSQDIGVGTGAGSGYAEPASSSPEPAGAQPDPVKLYADRLAAFRRVPHGAGRRAALSEALHDKLKAEMGR